MIKLGTLIPVREGLVSEVEAYAAAGFESVSFFIWENCEVRNLPTVLSRACEAAQKAGVAVSTFSVYGNPLRDDGVGQSIRGLWDVLVAEAAQLGVPVVSGFAGRVLGASVEASIPSWRALFAPLAEKAAAHGTKLAFENCRIGDTWKTGKWNIAINPDAWELMFSALDAGNIGLEWEPCHQLESLVDPYGQLEAWAHRVFHVHGKDAKVDHRGLAARGFYSPEKWHRSVLPGQGDSDWRRLLAILRAQGYNGAIDLENPGDGRDAELEALLYLKQTR